MLLSVSLLQCLSLYDFFDFESIFVAPLGDTGVCGNGLFGTVGDGAADTDRNFTNSFTDAGDVESDDVDDDNGDIGVSLTLGVARSLTSPKGETGVAAEEEEEAAAPLLLVALILLPDFTERSLTSENPVVGDVVADDVDDDDDVDEMGLNFLWNTAPLFTSLIILSRYSPE